MSADDIHHLLLTILYSGVGVAVFAVALYLMSVLSPFSLKKEIEEDQNTALGIIMGSILIGLALIISAAISSPDDVVREVPSQNDAATESSSP